MARKRVWLSMMVLSLSVFAVVWASMGLAVSSSQAQAQPLFQGPAQGTSASGASRNTTSFTSPAAPPGGYNGGMAVEKTGVELVELLTDAEPLSSPPPGSNEVDDASASGSQASQTATPVLADSFIGLTKEANDFGFSFIPPDPITAAGPNHLMAAVNSDFGIFDKSGTLLKRIDATVWFQNVLATLGPCDSPAGSELGCVFDPKVIYDHHSDRWAITYLAVNRTIGESWILLSVSDDADPNGLWCNWALDGDLNGATQTSPGNWSDYQGMGYDNQAVYVVPNQFRFTGEFDYAKIRILPKDTLYNTSCPAITWTDLWDIRFPADPPGAEAFQSFTIRPAVTFGEPGTEYLVANSIFAPPFNNFMALYKLTNPLSISPGLTAVSVPVTATDFPPNANQKDGSRAVSGCPAPCLIDVGGNRLRNAVYRDGSVWTAHSVADGSGSFARARYVRIDVATGLPTEDVSLGAANCWYYYPAIASAVNNNMAMVFNRSCSDAATNPPPEYVGTRYITRTDGANLQLPSIELKAGETNHVRTHGGPRNRWGDYSGIAVDPAVPNSI